MPAQKTPKDPKSSSHVLPIATEYDRLTHTRGWVLLATQILITSVTLINRMIHMAEFDINEQKLGKQTLRGRRYVRFDGDTRKFIQNEI